MLYTFGTYELDTQACELRCAGRPIALPPKVYHILVYLVQHHDRLIAKDELLEQVWPQTYVDDSAVKRCIMAARRAIGDHPTSPQHIKTVRGQGYRFIAPVTIRPAGVPAPDPLAVTDVHPVRTSEPDARVPITPSPDGVVQQTGRACPRCQSVQNPSARFCPLCGLALVRPCAQCGADVQAPAAFCSACGTPVARFEAIPAVSSAPEPPHAATPDVHQGRSERKLVTVLGCMVHNIATLVEQRGLDSVHTLMQGLYTCAQTEAQRYEGTLQPIPGEGFLLFFGVPVTQEDHARRAMLTAQALQGQLGTLPLAPDLSPDDPVSVSLALHTGHVVVEHHEMPRHSLIVGDTATFTVAMARQAPPGTLVASAATVQLLPTVQTASAPPVRVEPHRPPLTVYAIVAGGQRHGWLPSPGTHVRSPFVGREAELMVLQARLALVARGRGQVVSIIGEPGIGKSRLLDEFHKTILDRQISYLQGSCQSYGQTLPYLPLRDALRHAWGIHEGESPDVITRKVGTGLGPGGTDIDTWLPYILHLLGGAGGTACAALSAAALRVQTMAALHWTFAHLSQQQPCILVLENLHWVDATSATYLAALVERLAHLPLLVLVTCRPGYQPSWLDKSYASQVALQPLGPEESRALIRAAPRRPRLSATVEAQILRRAEGNPLFLEELVSALSTPTPPSHRGTMPATIQAVLAARMDRLPAPDKRLLQAAAVIGVEVPVVLLQAVLGHAETVVQAGLRQLQAAEFLYESRPAPEAVYTFQHVLTQEVAYESLVRAERQFFHRQIVAALEGVSPEAGPEQLHRLAHHAWHGELWDKAYAAFRQAGIQAASRSSHREAVLCFEQAIACLQHLPPGPQRDTQAIDIRFELRNALLPLGENRHILQLLQEVEPLALALDDAQRLGWVACYQSTEYFMMGLYDQALLTSQRALALSTTCQDVAMQVLAQLRLGQVYHAQGNYAEAMASLKRNTALLTAELRYERFGVAGLPAVHSLAWLAWCGADVGAFPEALAHGTEALAIASTAERPYDLLIASCGLGVVHLHQGNAAQAIAVLEPALTLGQRLAIPLLLPLVATFLGEAYALAGRFADALPLLEQLLEQERIDPPPATAGWSSLRLSYAYLLADRLDEAAQLAQWGLDLCQRRQERGHEAYAWWLMGELAAKREPTRTTTIDAHYQRALALARPLAMQPLLARCLLGLGSHYAQHGQRTQAATTLLEAQTLFAKLDMPWWHAKSVTALRQFGGLALG